ncbi:transcription elongation factor GreA [Spiroplasma sp. TIUS-1]|uniref:transcription elongation factor GreA n=1 Tax=Spiroplasma sp. TIUS-1 TaxID=216963 RepID=UPI001397AADE|nr:transcription elongation factor GreA [Spiroplasma sp. TIUS-1]QHX36042.1 transcription elongation factor GreA [Spiroplasma sp. TIUS-1]
MDNAVILTKEGLKQLEIELDNLITVVRPKVIEELVEARAQGDLSENADYDAARNRQAEVEARIKELEAQIRKASIIDEKKSTSKEKLVAVGTEVELLNKKNKKTYTFYIVGPIEADPFLNKISNESPIAEAILGKKVGDVVKIKNIQQPYEIQIKSIK